MERTPLLSVGVATVLLLAGCSAISGSLVGSPTPYAESGEALDVSELTSSHRAVLSNQSFTAEMTNTNSQSGQMAVSAHTITRIDRADGQYWQRHNTSYLNKSASRVDTRYTSVAKGVTVLRVTFSQDSDLAYSSSTSPYSDTELPPVNDTSAMALEHITGLVSDFSFTMDGVETYNGTTVTRFTATGPSNSTEATAAFGEDETLESYELTLLVANEKEYVRYFSATMDIANARTNETLHITQTYSFRDVGDTDVTRPTWIENATAASSA